MREKETNLPGRGGGMEKRREDGFAVILVKHEAVHPGEGTREAGGGEGINRLVLCLRTCPSLVDKG